MLQDTVVKIFRVNILQGLSRLHFMDPRIAVCVRNLIHGRLFLRSIFSHWSVLFTQRWPHRKTVPKIWWWYNRYNQYNPNPMQDLVAVGFLQEFWLVLHNLPAPSSSSQHLSWVGCETAIDNLGAMAIFKAWARFFFSRLHIICTIIICSSMEFHTVSCWDDPYP